MSNRNVMSRMYRSTTRALGHAVLAGLVLAAQPGCGGQTAASNPATAAAATAPTPTDNSEAPTEERTLPMIELRNARIAHGYLTGGPMTPAQIQEAKDKGYTRIIDLRMPEEEGVAEERAKAEEVGISYVSLPIDGEAGLTMDNIQAFADLLAEDAGPTIIHCQSGNRVGALFALHAYHIDKKPAEEALAIGRAAGLTRLEAYVRRVLGL